MIEVRDLRVRFGDMEAVRGVSFAVAQGGGFGIVGESGSGKSTVLRALSGLNPDWTGAMHIAGVPLGPRRGRDFFRRVQMVFQDPYGALHPRQTVDRQLSEPLLVHGLGDIDRRVSRALAEVALPPEARFRYPHQLSGGQRQRVAIARALIPEPRILVCDEPTSALDVSVQAQILNLLAELRAALNLTLVFISHNLAVVEHIADELAVMYLGRIVEHGPAEEIFAAPQHPYTRALLAAVLTPEPGLGLPDVPMGEGYPDPANIPAGCRFHPRCPVAIDICRVRPPERGDVECHLAPEPAHS